MTIVKYIGTYRVSVPESEYEAALDCHTGDRDAVASELDTLALVELEVLGAPHDFEITDFKQPHTECVPYNEEYFDARTLEPIPHEQYAPPAVSNFRVAFHLHFFDSSQVIQSPYGDLQVEAVTDPPSHLANKKYVYWD